MSTRFLVSALALALSTTAAMAGGASSATLSAPSGKVLVNTGSGFAAAVSDMPLQAGDTIFVGEGSSVLLGFAACSISLPETTTYTVPRQPPCGAQVPASSVRIEPVFGGGGFGGVDAQAIAVTGAVVGIIGLVGIMAANYDAPDKAASPN